MNNDNGRITIAVALFTGGRQVSQTVLLGAVGVARTSRTGRLLDTLRPSSVVERTVLRVETAWKPVCHGPVSSLPES